VKGERRSNSDVSRGKHLSTVMRNYTSKGRFRDLPSLYKILNRICQEEEFYKKRLPIAKATLFIITSFYSNREKEKVRVI